MTQSPSLHFFSLARDRKPIAATKLSPTSLEKAATPDKTHKQTNVRGWLMGVPGFHHNTLASKPKHQVIHESNQSILVDGDNNRIPIDSPRQLQHGRPESMRSVSSTDSVNLDDLIKNNFTVQVDDETDLPELGDLDIDDSTDDFWKLDLTNFQSAITRDATTQKQSSDHHETMGEFLISDDDDFLLSNKMVNDLEGSNNPGGYDWSPEITDDRLETLSNASFTSSRTVQSQSHASFAHASPRHSLSPSELDARYNRSGSISSENSMASQSTVTGIHQYGRFGMAPVMHSSESTSNSSRSHSRLSDYSVGSSQASSASGIPCPRTGSAASSGLPTQNGSRRTGRRTSTAASVDSTGTSASASERRLEATRPSSRTGAPSSALPQSRLAKRATHVPLSPSKPLPTPEAASKSRSTGLSMSTSGNRPGSRVGLRASHIPTTRNVGSSEPRSATARSPTLSPTRDVSGARSRSPLGAPTRFSMHNSAQKQQSIFSALPEATRKSGDVQGSRLRAPSSTNVGAKEQSVRTTRTVTGGTRTTGLRPPSSFAKTGRNA